MWTILIVEDEAHVRKSLIKNGCWEESGFTVIGEASNGETALAFIKEHRPDLVICDIVMPIMNGIDLLKKTRESDLTGLFVMLTCMNEFEYARLALQNGAFDYMLKLSMNTGALRSMLAKVDAELRRLAGQTSLRTLVEAQPLYAAMWERLTDVKQEPAAEPFGKYMEAMPPYVTVCSALNGSEPFTVNEYSAMQLTERDTHAIVHRFSAMGITTLFYWSRTEPKTRPPQGRASSFPLAICVSVPKERLFEAWASVLGKLDECWYSGEKQVLYADGELCNGGSEQMLSWKIERILIQYFEQAKLKECEVLLEEIWNRMEQGAFPTYRVKHAANQFDKLLFRISPYAADASCDLSMCTSHRELKNKLLARLRSGMGGGKRGKDSFTDHGEINKILDYIHEYYGEPITLKSMARFVALEEHYLSSLFKKKTGWNFIDYLHGVRIEKAKHFLDHSGMTVHEVGKRVGFVNDNYFIKIFKRFAGKTPNMYRQAKGNDSGSGST